VNKRVNEAMTTTPEAPALPGTPGASDPAVQPTGKVLPKLEIDPQPPTLYPFGEALVARAPNERVIEEVYQSIPALLEIADATVALSHLITSDARNALFFPQQGMDVGLRELAVELALKRRADMESAQADPAYMNAVEKPSRQEYETADNDLWMPKPPGPNSGN
jgi:hypothetical protein